jgi:hypothetical protein
MVKKFFRDQKKSIVLGSIGVLAGALGGFLYWKYVGCISGTCAIWSNPIKSTFYGALLGGLLLLAFAPDSSKTKNTD